MVEAKKPRVHGNRIEYKRNGLTEWYVNGPLGLQQGFTVDRRPTGSKRDTLTLELSLSGGLRAVVDADGTGLTLEDPDGVARFRYTGLTAYDADERTLPARLEAVDGTVRIHVDACGARYPVVIDPIFQTAKLLAKDGAAYDRLGCSVSISGDTVVVGAYCDDDKGNDSGSAYVFVKPTGGWNGTYNQAAKLLASDGAMYDWFGYSVSISGDTVVVGAYGDDDKGSKSGSAYVFVKPTGGWNGTYNQTAKLLASDGAPGDYFGCSVSISGDTVVVGAKQESLYTGLGKAYVSHGIRG